MKLRTRKTSPGRRALLTVLPLLLVAGALISALYYQRKSIDSSRNQAFTVLEEASVHQAEALRAAIGGRFDVLRSAASHLASENGDADKAETSAFLDIIAKTSSFPSVFYIDTHGVAIYNNGNQRSMIGDEVFQMAAAGAETAVLTGTDKGARPLLSMAVPVLREGETVGVLGGSFVLDYFRPLIDEAYSGKGYTFLCESDGRVLLTSEGDGAVPGVENILSAQSMADRDGAAAATMRERLAQDLASGGSGLFSYGTDEALMFCAYTPLGLGDCTVFTAVGDSVVSLAVEEASRTGYVLVGIGTVISVLLVLFILLLERSRQHQLEEEAHLLRISDERLNIVLDSTSLTVWDYDYATSSIIQSERTAAAHGMTGDIVTDVPESIIRNGHIHPDNEDEYREMYAKLRAGEMRAEGVFRIRPANREEWIYEHVSYTAVADEQGVFSRAIGISEDLTEQISAKQRYEREVRFQLVLTADAVASAIVDLTSREVIRVSNKADLSGVETRELTFENFLDFASKQVVDDERTRGLFASLTADDLLELYRHGQTDLKFEYIRKLPRGERWVREELRLVQEPDNGHLMLFILLRDIDATRRQVDSLTLAAETDSMTGLLNHTATIERITSYLSGEGKDATSALFVVDIDYFKHINDTYGHQMGDHAIISAAKAIRSIFRPEDIVGRIGGDEFIAFMKNAHSDDIISRRATALVEALQLECTAERQTIHLTVSVGVSIYHPETPASAAELYSMADAALYEAKHNGRNRWEAATPLQPGSGAQKDAHTEPMGAVQLHTLMQYMDGGVALIEVGVKLTLRYVSPSYFRLVDMPEATTCTMPDIQRLVHEDDFASLASAIRGAVNGGEAIEHSYRTRTPQGVVRWHHIRAVRIPEGSGLPVVLGVISDVTESRRLEKTLSESRRSVVATRQADAVGDVRRTVLVVDDEPINCRMLEKILAEEYTVLTAANGLDALEILKRFPEDIAAVLLDLIMPVMDGKGFLEAKRRIPEIAEIPVMVVSAAGESDKDAEAGALESGAWDYLTKPYRPDVIRFRLKNAILRSQLAALDRLRYLSEYDELTGLPNKQKFFTSARSLLMSRPELRFCFIRFDINYLSAVNSYFGTDEGDRVLVYISRGLDRFFGEREDCAYGRIESDVFGVIMPYVSEEETLRVLEHSREILRAYKLDFKLTPTFGLYIVEDPSTPMERIYERANLAARSCKGDHVKGYAFYAPEMGRAADREREIEGEMDKALESGQFVCWLQPQFDLRTGRIIAAEALTRWQHPVKGLIAPGEFIPLFERNGFITRMDRYIWEQVCVLLRRWLDSDFPSVPVGVNISRVNLYNPHLAEDITALADKYALPHELLHLEITESACAQAPPVMLETLNTLRDNGFTLLMDDFGTGYSSLNSLRELPVDVMKLDLRFLSDDQSLKSESVLTYTVELARSLGMATVAEGVETREQAEYLASVGCDSAQGYYFARPIPVDKFERLLPENRSRTDGAERFQKETD